MRNKATFDGLLVNLYTASVETAKTMKALWKRSGWITKAVLLFAFILLAPVHAFTETLAKRVGVAIGMLIAALAVLLILPWTDHPWLFAQIVVAFLALAFLSIGREFASPWRRMLIGALTLVVISFTTILCLGGWSKVKAMFDPAVPEYELPQGEGYWHPPEKTVDVIAIIPPFTAITYWVSLPPGAKGMSEAPDGDIQVQAVHGDGIPEPLHWDSPLRDIQDYVPRTGMRFGNPGSGTRRVRVHFNY